jgi:hypothetical protein
VNPTDRPEPARIPPYLQAGAGAGAHERDRRPPTHRPDPAEPARSAPGTAHRPRPRPFVLTAGRVTSADPEIGLETQVSAVRSLPPWAAPVSTLAPELQVIIDLCDEPTSVAEISAQVPLHLGVTKVLVSDLRATGHLDVHAGDTADPHDPDLILRVIRGLRAIS